MKSASRFVKNIGVSGNVQGGTALFSGTTGFTLNNLSANDKSDLNQDKTLNQSFNFQIQYDLKGI